MAQILGDYGILVGNDADKASVTPAIAAATEGRIYFASDTGKLYRDSGSAWVEVFAMPKDGTVTAAKVAADVATQAELDAHISDSSAAHAASAIEFTPAAGIAATDVQAAIVEDAGDLAAHLADSSAAHAASAIAFTPNGSIAATDVQAAIQEVRDEAAGGGATDLDDLTDVDVTSTPPSDGDVLTYDNGSSLWIPAAPSGGGGSLTIEEVDGSPTDSAVTKLVLPDGSLQIASHVATYTPRLHDVFGKVLTPPVASDFPTGVNMGAATLDSTEGYLRFDCAADAADSWKIRYRTAPSPPYTETFYAIGNLAHVNYNSYGIGFRESSSGNWRMYYFDWEGNYGYGVGRNTGGGANITTLVTTRQLVSGGYMPRWIRIRDDNTNRYYEYSDDGRRWHAHYSEGRTVTITADQVFIAVMPRNASEGCSVGFLHWAET